MAAKRDTETFQRILPPVVPDWDDAEIDEEASTYLLADQRGPEAVPGWVITEDAARQQDLGVLKGGKEADVHLVERRFGSAVNVLAAKQYRGFEDRLFRNDARYRTGRRTGKSRVDRAMAKGSTAGMAFRAHQWVTTEFEVLGRLWSAGISVPYPVQLMGNEILLELIGSPDRVAPRLAQAGVSAAQARQLWPQIVDNLRLMVRTGVVHGDLSAYNVLLDGQRAVFIDFPQAVDPIAHPEGMSLLERDVLNLTGWFDKRGVHTDASELVAELIGEVVRNPWARRRRNIT
jgi:RIO kinase 1